MVVYLIKENKTSIEDESCDETGKIPRQRFDHVTSLVDTWTKWSPISSLVSFPPAEEVFMFLHSIQRQLSPHF